MLSKLLLLLTLMQYESTKLGAKILSRILLSLMFKHLSLARLLSLTSFN